MTDHTNLIAELRYVAQWAEHHLDKAKIVNDGADALEALQDQLDMQAGSIEAVQAANQRLAAERESLRAEVERLTTEKKAAAMNYEAQIDWLNGDKEVLLGHMDTINRCSNDPAIYNLSKVVIERFSAGAAPKLNEADAALWLTKNKLQQHEVLAQAAPTKEQT